MLTSKRKPSALTKQQVELFKKLAAEWKHETEIVGNLSKIVMHPSYQANHGNGT
ncbi:MAG TPA: hypothetical protein VG759_00990 [Candidatus Angelobacter sp.]|nr:hypothetical protein [Candidatus Angelobacter sp.]